MELKKDKQINYQFKLLSAIAMIAVVAGHCHNAGIGGLFTWLEPYSWHLPLFCFISGYFFEAVPIKQYSKFVWKKFKRLIIPLFIYTMVYSIFMEIISFKDFSIGLDIIHPMWYVVPLFFCFVIYQLIVNIFKNIRHNNEIIQAILVLLFLVIFWYYKLSLSFLQSGLMTFIARIFLLLTFLCLGNNFKNKYEAILNKISTEKIIISSLIVRFVLLALEDDHSLGYTISWQSDFENKNAFIVLLGSINAIVILYELTKILVDFIPPKYYIVIADNTYDIMANHVFGFFVLNTLIAIISKVISGFEKLSFDWYSYKANWFYFYAPFSQFYILYLIFGISISLIIVDIKNKCKSDLLRCSKNRNRRSHEFNQ